MTADPIPPFVVRIQWFVGDKLDIDYGDLQPWEAVDVLERAMREIEDAVEADLDAEAEP